MDLFKKGTLKSQSLNSRFLASNNNNSSSTPSRSLPVQPSKPSLPSQHSSLGNASKLKLTTSRQSSSARLNRENSSSGHNDAGQQSTKDVALEKKAPVWNKGMLPAKSAKEYTDEELKAMHGISLVARKSNAPGEVKEGRWDDSDEDDDWGDTIDFGDGTKVTIGQAAESEAIEKAALSAPVPRPANFTPATNSPFGSVLGSPWKRSEFLQSPALRSPAEFPSVEASNLPKESALQQVAAQTSVVQPNIEKLVSATEAEQTEFADERQRVRNESFNRGGRMQQSGDARYQYEQNTYDRHWQNPLPQTREIYNSVTGRLEQIDPPQKQGRRLSHVDRKPSESLPRLSPVSGDARTGFSQSNTKVADLDDSKASTSSTLPTVPVSGALQADEESLRPQALSTKSEAAETVIPEIKPLDPSSQEFIDMQKQLMAERREQAIQRRRDQESEENARKERARKKAEELAALAEQERAEADQIARAKAESSKPKVVPKILTRPANPDAEKYASATKTSQEIKQKEELPKSVNQVRNKTTMNQDRMPWERPGRVTTNVDTEILSAAVRKPSQPPRTTSFELARPTTQDVAIHGDEASGAARESAAGSQPGWGPIGSKKSVAAHDRDDERPRHASMQGNRSVSASSGATPSWSAFDSISSPRTLQTNLSPDGKSAFTLETPNGLASPEKNWHSPPGQPQNRTSSRFFPAPIATDATKPSKIQGPFISPLLPPRFPDDKDVDSAPVLSLPAAASSLSSPGRVDKVPKIMKTFRQPLRSWYDIQTRSIWEVKPPKEGFTPRIKVPHSEKQLDWSRKDRRVPEHAVDTESSKLQGDRSSATVSSPKPLVPAWNLPIVLDTTTRDNNIREPLIPPQPALKLPAASGGLDFDRTHRNTSEKRQDQDRTSKYFTTRPSLTEEISSNSPIRIKTTVAEFEIPRKFGKRIDPSQTPQRKRNDVKRQPVNMSDAPGGSGFKRGFGSRVRGPRPDFVSSETPEDALVALESISKHGSNKSSTPTAIVPRRTETDNSTEQVNRALTKPHNTSLLYANQLPSVQHYPSDSSVPMHSPMNGSLVSRIGPPGLSGPLPNANPEDSLHTISGASTGSAPPHTHRGPPGIV